MAMVVGIADVNQYRSEEEDFGNSGYVKGGELKARFFDFDNPDLPHARLKQHDPGRFSSTHFHPVDQFQVLVGGKAKIGRHELAAYCVHFARAYTPYGPIIDDAVTGSTMFVMRAHSNTDAQRLPQKLDRLKQVPDRQPWQIHRPITFPAFQSGTAATDIMLEAVPDIKDENGLAVYTLSMKPNAKACAPDPSHGDGQFLVVFKGSLLHNNKEHKAWAVVFIKPKEGPFQIHAGAGGLEALVLNFPRPKTQVARAATSVQTITGFKIWQCAICAFVYDEAAGLPEEGIAPGTRWKDVPETWTCPDCNASKSDFQMIELR